MIGHNPKASQNQLDDLQDVAALLRSLPQVSAPVDFQARLQARLATAKAEASEFADITSLIKELPRVTAPADFNFKVRARIAQAKAEQGKASAGWLAELFGRSFSWAQASATLAVVVVIVSAVAFGILRSGNSVKPPDTVVAVVNTTPQPRIIDETKVTQALPSNSKHEVVAAKPLSVNPTPKPSRAAQLPPSIEGNSNQISTVTEPGNQATSPTRTVIIKHSSGEARVVNLSEYNLGLQTASLRTTPANGTPNKVDTVAANIY